MIKFSFVIPIYNRPEELRELLDSLAQQVGADTIPYEIIVVEDGSTLPSEEVVKSFAQPIKYITQKNSGPSGARNRGVAEATGEWVVFLDSDAVLPEGYLREIDKCVEEIPCDLWGGPDRAREDFTIIQKAINYSMTSLLTTGGIRGKKKSVDHFYPRTFNMGIRRELFNQLGGFRPHMRYGEDLDLSMRALESGAKSALFPDAWVYHKRRVTFKSFFRQIHHSGKARIVLNRYHPGTLKLAHTLPALFVIFNLSILLTLNPTLYAILLIYPLAIVIDIFIREGNLHLAGYAVIATYVQHFAYGLGFLQEWIFPQQTELKQ